MDVSAETLIRAEMADRISDGYWEWDLVNPEFEYMSPKFWTTLGYNPDDMPHSPSAWKDKVHPEDEKRAVADFYAHLGREKKPYKLLVRYYHADGGIVWILCRGQAVYNDQKTPMYMVGSHQDVTGVVSGNLSAGEQLQQSSQGALESMERILNLLGEE